MNQPIEEKCCECGWSVSPSPSYRCPFHCHKPIEEKEKIDSLVRDFTQVIPRSKSEVRRRIKNLLEQEKRWMSEEIEKLKLPVPNPYGDWVTVQRVNMLLDKAKAIINK